MNTKTENVLPKKAQNAVELLPEGPEQELAGSVCVQWVRCSRSGCRCERGELHGPYYYRFWRENGRLKKEYVPCQKMKSVKAACLRRQTRLRQEKLNSQEGQEMTPIWRDMREIVRSVEAAVRKEKRRQSEAQQIPKRLEAITKQLSQKPAQKPKDPPTDLRHQTKQSPQKKRASKSSRAQTTIKAQATIK